MDFVTDVSVIAGAIIAVAAVGGLYYKRFVAPPRDMIRRMEAVEAKVLADYKELKRQREGDQAIYSALIAILIHLEQDNHTEAMKKAREKLTEHLVER
ncbi:MAG: hypothetical protein LBQ21_07400 [Clostridiales Family XIII bacterium]|jgi:hypothetical protein|nr:hypothetical protein [Clostridiales Family XIII bacterium]